MNVFEYLWISTNITEFHWQSIKFNEFQWKCKIPILHRKSKKFNTNVWNQWIFKTYENVWISIKSNTLLWSSRRSTKVTFFHEIWWESKRYVKVIEFQWKSFNIIENKWICMIRWLPIQFNRKSWTSMKNNGFQWTSINFNWDPWISLEIHKLQLKLINSYATPMNFHEHQWISMNIYKFHRKTTGFIWFQRQN
jgi:hypothetical protein